MTSYASLPALYHRSRLQAHMDENKIDMGLMPAWPQDRLDRDLVRAVLDDHVRGLREMVALGADVNRLMQAPVAGAPLHLAADRCGLRTVVTLLQLGADPAQVNAAGQTAADIAAARWARGESLGGRIRTLLKLWAQRRLREAYRPVNDDEGDSQGRGASAAGVLHLFRG